MKQKLRTSLTSRPLYWQKSLRPGGSLRPGRRLFDLRYLDMSR